MSYYIVDQGISGVKVSKRLFSIHICMSSNRVVSVLSLIC